MITDVLKTMTPHVSCAPSEVPAAAAVPARACERAALVVVAPAAVDSCDDAADARFTDSEWGGVPRLPRSLSRRVGGCEEEAEATEEAPPRCTLTARLWCKLPPAVGSRPVVATEYSEYTVLASASSSCSRDRLSLRSVRHPPHTVRAQDLSDPRRAGEALGGRGLLRRTHHTKYTQPATMTTSATPATTRMVVRLGLPGLCPGCWAEQSKVAAKVRICCGVNDTEEETEDNREVEAGAPPWPVGEEEAEEEALSHCWRCSSCRSQTTERERSERSESVQSLKSEARSSSTGVAVCPVVVATSPASNVCCSRTTTCDDASERGCSVSRCDCTGSQWHWHSVSATHSKQQTQRGCHSTSMGNPGDVTP